MEAISKYRLVKISILLKFISKHENGSIRAKMTDDGMIEIEEPYVVDGKIFKRNVKIEPKFSAVRYSLGYKDPRTIISHQSSKI